MSDYVSEIEVKLNRSYVFDDSVGNFDTIVLCEPSGKFFKQDLSTDKLRYDAIIKAVQQNSFVRFDGVLIPFKQHPFDIIGVGDVVKLQQSFDSFFPKDEKLGN